jgi:hypothetical protein
MPLADNQRLWLLASVPAYWDLLLKLEAFLSGRSLDHFRTLLVIAELWLAVGTPQAGVFRLHQARPCCIVDVFPADVPLFLLRSKW